MPFFRYTVCRLIPLLPFISDTWSLKGPQMLSSSVLSCLSFSKRWSWRWCPGSSTNCTHWSVLLRKWTSCQMPAQPWLWRTLLVCWSSELNRTASVYALRSLKSLPILRQCRSEKPRRSTFLTFHSNHWLPFVHWHHRLAQMDPRFQ